jgi:hypothetical protein
VSGSDNAFFGAGAGAFNASGGQNSFFGNNAGTSNVSGDNNSFFGYKAGDSNTSGSNSFFGSQAGEANTAGSSNAFFGRSTGASNTTGDHNTLIGAGANVATGNLSFATAIGAGASASASNTVVLGRPVDDVIVPGNLAVNILGTSGAVALCRNVSTNQIASCSSSLRYKSDVQTFSGGLEIVRRLRPISFTWRDGGQKDVGFGAEEVEQIEPLLVTYNKQGQIEGVKYGQITTVLVNAVRQQQQIIEQQEERFKQQEERIKSQEQHMAAQQKALERQLREIERLKNLFFASRLSRRSTIRR